jgi:TPR repeat protein
MRGHGVPLDYAEAYKWFGLAAMQDAQGAARALNTVGAIMTNRQVSAAQVRIALWRVQHPKSGSSSANVEPWQP